MAIPTELNTTATARIPMPYGPLNITDGSAVAHGVNEASLAIKAQPAARRIPLPAGTFTKPSTVRYVEAPRGIPTPEEKRAYLNKRKKFLAHKRGG